MRYYRCYIHVNKIEMEIKYMHFIHSSVPDKQIWKFWATLRVKLSIEWWNGQMVSFERQMIYLSSTKLFWSKMVFRSALMSQFGNKILFPKLFSTSIWLPTLKTQYRKCGISTKSCTTQSADSTKGSGGGEGMSIIIDQKLCG